jgi:putative transposase
MSRRVYETVREKRAWQAPPESAEADIEQLISSRGWYTRGYLPHFDKPGTIQMVTSRLADAMPTERRQEWEALLAIEDQRECRTRIEEYLDRGHGACYLRDPIIARLVEDNFLHADGQRYRLLAWIVMPNHVHVLFELWNVPLALILKSWKSYTARMANRMLNRSGKFWQREYWDRYIRDESHFNRARHYIEWNPVKANLVRSPEEWPWSSANPKWPWSEGSRYERGHLLHDRNGALTARSAADGSNDQRRADVAVSAPIRNLSSGTSDSSSVRSGL